MNTIFFPPLTAETSFRYFCPFLLFFSFLLFNISLLFLPSASGLLDTVENSPTLQCAETEAELWLVPFIFLHNIQTSHLVHKV